MSLIKKRTNKHFTYAPDAGEPQPLSEMDLAKHKLVFGETKFGMTSGPLVMEFISRRIKKLARRIDQYSCPERHYDQSKWVERAVLAQWDARRLKRETKDSIAPPRAGRL